MRRAGGAPPSDSRCRRRAPSRGPLRPEARELGGKLAGKTLPRQVFVLAVWPFFELVLNALVGIVDTVIAGHLTRGGGERDRGRGVRGLAAEHAQRRAGRRLVGGRGPGDGGGHKGLVNAAVGQAVLLAFVWGVVSGLGCFCWPSRSRCSAV